jgi:hypothetical protein
VWPVFSGPGTTTTPITFVSTRKSPIYRLHSAPTATISSRFQNAKSQPNPPLSAAAGRYTEGIASFPYSQTNLNPYDYRISTPYDERGIISYFNNVTVQSELGVLSPDETRGKKWNAHSQAVWNAFVSSGDWETRTDGLIGMLLDEGVGVLMYEGMVDCESTSNTE